MKATDWQRAAEGRGIQGSRPLTLLACALPRIRRSDQVDPSARRKMWYRKCEECVGGTGLQGCGKGRYVVFTPHVSSGNSRTRQG